MPLKPGDRIDRYVIEAPLGQGGMGEVYQALDTRLQRLVALKVLREVPDRGDSANPSAGEARMLREARAAAALEHPNVVAVFDVGHVDGKGDASGMTYLAMELIKGASLRSYVGDGSVPVSERLRWLTDIARALGAAHRAGLVHRDVKPENVMIREDGAVKVLDFGIARRAQSAIDPTSSTEGLSVATLTAHGVVIGTPLYMAPEQLRAADLDGRADQFSWGVVAYELLAGKVPWSVSEGGVALVAQILSADPPPLAIPELPEHVTRTIARALEKHRNSRFPSMEVAIEALAGRVDAFAATSAAVPPVPSMKPRQPSGARADAFASAPTEAVLTPPTRREGRPVPPPSPRARGWRPRVLAAVAVALIVVGVAAAVTMRMRASNRAAAEAARTTPKPPGCTSNKACVDAHEGKPWICREDDHECVSLASQDCSVLAEPGDVEADSTVWIGTLYPLSADPMRSAAEAAARETDLARRDFADTLGKVVGTRHIGIVSCDASADLRRAARHLADDVHVPAALVGIVNPTDIIEVESKLLATKDVLAMLPFSSSPMVTALPPGPSGRLVYRTTYSTDALLGPTAALVESVLEPQIRARGQRRIRVAFLHGKVRATGVFYDHLLTTLRFNGKSVVDNGDDFRDVAYDDDARSYEAAVQELSTFQPSIVLARLSPDAVGGIVIPLEEAWRPGVPRPTYVLSKTFDDEVLAFVGADAARRRRFFAMDIVSATAAFVELTNHFNQTFDTQSPRTDISGTVFDAFYALAYSIHSLGTSSVTGPAIAHGFRRLAGPGKTFFVGPQSIFEAYRELLSGAAIDLEGTSGHLDLDPSSGESSSEIAILCPSVRQAGTPDHAVESGLVFDPRRHAFTGSITCR